jgi:hypothetical protein
LFGTIATLSFFGNSWIIRSRAASLETVIPYFPLLPLVVFFFNSFAFHKKLYELMTIYMLFSQELLKQIL